MPCYGSKVIEAKRDHPSIRGNHMDAAITDPFQVQVPGILKGHTGNGKHSCPDTFQKTVKSLRFIFTTGANCGDAIAGAIHTFLSFRRRPLPGCKRYRTLLAAAACR